VVRPVIQESEILKEASMPFEIGPLAAALVFSAVFLLGSKSLIPRSLLRHQRKVLSFGAGVTIAYVFVHLLPELEAAREVLGHNEARMGLPIPALRVYLGALVGFMSFYALRHVMEKAGRPAGSHEAHGGENRLLRSAHTGAFLVYVWLAGYLAVRSFEEGATPIILYAVALGLHFLALDFSLSREYGSWYDRSVRYVFALAPLAGWAVGFFVEFSPFFTAALLGFLSGGIILNALVTELPKEEDARPLAFLFGGALYTALLVILS
jgi:hypothetical protein